MTLKAAATLLRAGSAESGSSAPSSASFQARLEELEREPPPWLISSTRLLLDTGGDGRLVLLGRGSFG